MANRVIGIQMRRTEQPIYFPMACPARHDHEHIVVDSDNNVVYWRDKDGTVIIDSDSDNPIRY